MDQVGHDVPSWLAIDYDRTWDSALRFDFDFEGQRHNVVVQLVVVCVVYVSKE